MTESLHWKAMGTRTVSVNNVHIKERILPPTKTRVDAMAKSLSGSLGQLQPILVTKYLHSAWKVVAGATRLLAAKQLGWKEIEATIISADNDIEYQLIEIAENLDRHDLTQRERSQLGNKEKKLRAQQIAEIEAEVRKQAKAKGGRGRKGGLANAARKAGVPRTTAQDRLKKPAGKSNPAGLAKSGHLSKGKAEPPKSEMVKCPMCGGTGSVVRHDEVSVN